MTCALARMLGLGALAATLALPASAAPPQVNAVSPLGVQRGVATELTLSGAGLSGNPRLVAPFALAVVSPAPGGSTAATFRVRVTVDPTTPLGVYPLRVQTDLGLSSPFLLAVGQLAQVAEKEDNGTFETAQVIDTPVVVEGQASGNDVDCFRFHGKKHQRVVVDAQCARIGSGVDPSIRLTMADHTFVASADDSPGLLTDARLFAVLPADADYVIELSDSRYQGGGRPVYRLTVGEVPAAEEVFPLGGRPGETVGLELRGGTLDGMKVAAATLHAPPGLSTAFLRVSSTAPGLDVESLPPLAVSEIPSVREPADPAAPPVRAAAPVVFEGRIDPPGDEDRFVLAVAPGQSLRVEVVAASAGSSLDGTLRVLDARGGVIASADDTTIPGPPNQPPLVSADPSLEFTVPAGQSEVTLALKDLENRGGIGFPYRIRVTPVAPGFDLLLGDAQVSVPRGGAAGVEVTVVRKGYNGPIALRVADPPAGLTVRPGAIGEGQTVGSFTVAAARDAAFGVVVLDVVGEAPGGIVRKAVKTLVFAQQWNVPTNQISQQGLVAAPATAAPLALDAPASPIELAHGLGTTIQVAATRPASAEGALALTPLPLPPGLAIAPAKLEAKATGTAVSVNTSTELPPGTMTFVLTAKGTIAGAERSLAVPAVTLRIVRPAAVELAAKGVELKPGATAEVNGKVVRRGGFKDVVTVKADGLPAGVKAGPVTVAPGASDFRLTLSADAKAPAATASAHVVLAFQINKKDYPAPVTAPLGVKVLPAK